MPRIPTIPAADYNAEQQALFDSITGGDRARLRPKKEFLNAEGGLGGPFGPWIHSPTLGDPAQSLGAAVRFHNHLNPILREIAICVVGAHTRAEYEWWAHSNILRAEGMSDAVIDKIAARETPQFEREDEAAVYAFARELAETSQVSDDTYATARAQLDDASIVDLVITVGYYNMVSMCLNVFEIPLPDGVDPVFS